MSATRLVVAVDGGGTKTDCCLAEESEGRFQIIGRGLAAGSNPAMLGVERALEAIGEAVARARSDAGLAATKCDRGAFALAGTLDDALRMAMERSLPRLRVADHYRVFPDLLPIVLASSATGVGVALISGTGSVAAARNTEGRLAVAGGWGYLLGDEGSGFAIGRAAVRLALHELETETGCSKLGQRIQAALAAPTTDQLKQAVYAATDTRRFLAGLAPLVLQAATDGDPLATDMIARAAAELAAIVERAASRLDLPRDPLPLAVAGGLLVQGSSLREALGPALPELGISAVVEQVSDPAAACLRLTLDPYFQEPIRLAS